MLKTEYFLLVFCKPPSQNHIFCGSSSNLKAKEKKMALNIFILTYFNFYTLFLLNIKRLGGGGGGILGPPPPSDFLDSSKTAADIDTKLSVPSPPSRFNLLSKFKISEKSNDFF